MSKLNLNELDTLYRRITALELIERFKKCGIVWGMISPGVYAITYKYKGDIWDIKFFIQKTYLMEFSINGFYYITLDSAEETDLISFWNEMVNYDNFEKEKLLLRDLTQIRDCRDNKIYDQNLIGFGVVLFGTGIDEHQVSWKPRNVVASQSSVLDSDDETLDVIPNFSFALLEWDAPPFDGGESILEYVVQFSKDSVTWYDGDLASSWNSSTNSFNQLIPTATSSLVLGLETASSYSFRIAALNEIGLSDWAYSNSVCLIAGKPIDVFAAQTGPNEVIITWNEQNLGICDVVNHGVKYWKNNVSQGWVTFSENILGSTAIITDLEPGIYEFKVGTFIGTIIGPMSSKSLSITILENGIGALPYDIEIDSDGNLYTCNAGSNNVSKITPAGVSTILGTIKINSLRIVVDSDGNIYTSNSGSNNVSKITPAGVSTILGATELFPVGIVVDGDGNVYTANQVSNNVSKITPAGVSTILGTTELGPYGIAIDIEGNIYTANYGSDNVSKITSDGVSTILGTTGSNPSDIVFDSDGNIYTSNSGSDDVSKITPDGVSTILGATAINPRSIAIDSDGNIYTSNADSNNVSKITPAGVSTILGTTGLVPYGIAIDSDGNIYTSNIGLNNVSKITPAGVSTIFSG